MQNKKLKVRSPLVSGTSSSSCKICTYPVEIRSHIEHLRTVLGYTLEEISKEIRDRWESWKSDGAIGEGDTPPTNIQLTNHFRDHCKLTAHGKHSADPQLVRISLVQESLNSRCELYRDMSGIFSRLLQMAQAKLRRLEDLYSYEGAFYDKFREEISDYRQKYQQYLEDVRRHQEQGETEYVGTPPQVPSLQIPNGIISEERRTLRLLDQARQQASDMSKVLSYEDGFKAYVVIEVESLLRDLYEDLLPKVLQAQNRLSTIVPGDRHDKLRSYLREFAMDIQSAWKVRFKSFIKDLNVFTRGLKQ